MNSALLLASRKQCIIHSNHRQGGRLQKNSTTITASADNCASTHRHKTGFNKLCDYFSITTHCPPPDDGCSFEMAQANAHRPLAMSIPVNANRGARDPSREHRPSARLARDGARRRRRRLGSTAARESQAGREAVAAAAHRPAREVWRRKSF